jgi:hypothetical protein
LIQFYKNHHANQEVLIRKTMEEQNRKLSARIEQRSKSKSNRVSSPWRNNHRA